MTINGSKRIFILVVTFILYSPLSFLHAEDLGVSAPVGVMHLELPDKAFSLVSLPLQPFSNSLDAVLSGQLTGSTNEATADRIYKWDPAAGYLRAFKADGTGDPELDGKWFSDFSILSNSDLTLSPGEGFFIENRQGTNQSVFLAGRIVLDATNSVILYPGLNLVGYPFSSVGELPMGKGYWATNTTDVARVWLETRPYADVFPPEGSLPAITCIRIQTPTSSFKFHPSSFLSIRCTGTLLDIFYKDLAATNVFDSEHNWLIAASNIPVTSATLEWQDQGSETRPPINEVFARYYLVARADIDVNQNDIPDARERFVMNGASLACLGVASELSRVGASLTDARSSTNSLPVVSVPQDLRGRIIYVDKARGRNNLSGRAPVEVGAHGPKKTIHAGLAEAQPGDTVIIKSGSYGEHLNIAGRSVSVVIQGNVNLTGPAPVENAPVIPISIVNSNEVNTNAVRR